MSFEDKTLVCADCQAEFLHSASDQERYAERGFTNEPKRCPACRQQRKTSASRSRRPERSGGGGSRFGGSFGGGGGGRGDDMGGGRPPREMHDAVCSECGQQTQVPFRPAEGRPVYCRTCHEARKRG